MGLLLESGKDMKPLPTHSSLTRNIFNLTQANVINNEISSLC